MPSKCDYCEKAATIHLTEIVDGAKIEKHLCEQCAAMEGLTVKPNVPISQILEDFLLQGSSGEGQQDQSGLACEVCGLTLLDFRRKGVLGCPHDYHAFEQVLGPMLERQQGSTEHVGKVPRRSGQDQKRQNAVLKLRAQLRGAIAAEDYESAALLRDRIKELEGS